MSEGGKGEEGVDRKREEEGRERGREGGREEAGKEVWKRKVGI